MLFLFFFNDTATTEIYTLSLHDALPISWPAMSVAPRCTPIIRTGPASSTSARRSTAKAVPNSSAIAAPTRSEEHTSELQSQSNLVCRLLLEKKKNKYKKARTESSRTEFL